MSGAKKFSSLNLSEFGRKPVPVPSRNARNTFTTIGGGSFGQMIVLGERRTNELESHAQTKEGHASPSKASPATQPTSAKAELGGFSSQDNGGQQIIGTALSSTKSAVTSGSGQSRLEMTDSRSKGNSSSSSSSSLVAPIVAPSSSSNPWSTDFSSGGPDSKSWSEPHEPAQNEGGPGPVYSESSSSSYQQQTSQPQTQSRLHTLYHSSALSSWADIVEHENSILQKTSFHSGTVASGFSAIGSGSSHVSSNVDRGHKFDNEMAQRWHSDPSNDHHVGGAPPRRPHQNNWRSAPSAFPSTAITGGPRGLGQEFEFGHQLSEDSGSIPSQILSRPLPVDPAPASAIDKSLDSSIPEQSPPTLISRSEDVEPSRLYQWPDPDARFSSSQTVQDSEQSTSPNHRDLQFIDYHRRDRFDSSGARRRLAHDPGARDNGAVFGDSPPRAWQGNGHVEPSAVDGKLRQTDYDRSDLSSPSAGLLEPTGLSNGRGPAPIARVIDTGLTAKLRVATIDVTQDQNKVDRRDAGYSRPTNQKRGGAKGRTGSNSVRGGKNKSSPATRQPQRETPATRAKKLAAVNPDLYVRNPVVRLVDRPSAPRQLYDPASDSFVPLKESKPRDIQRGKQQPKTRSQQQKKHNKKKPASQKASQK